MFDGGGNGGLSMSPFVMRRFFPVSDILQHVPVFDTAKQAGLYITTYLSPDLDYEIINQNGKFHIWYSIRNEE